MAELPAPIRAALGLVASVTDVVKDGRGWPELVTDRALELPVLAVSTVLQLSLRAQQQYAALTVRGDEFLNQLRGGAPEEPPTWAQFDDETTLAPEEPAAETPAVTTRIAETSTPKQPAPKKAAKQTAAARPAGVKKVSTKAPANPPPVEKTAAKKTVTNKPATAKKVPAPRTGKPSAFDLVETDGESVGE
jgi:hypothetical protein